jgi:caffeoyl-CoA O-methyltransferase
MDINRENYELGLPCIEKAGVAHKIDFREGPALPILDDLIADVRKKECPLARSIIQRLKMSAG